MKRINLLHFTVTCLGLIFIGITSADNIADGGEHTVDGIIYGSLLVQDSIVGESTTVNVVTGCEVWDQLVVYDTSRLNVYDVWVRFGVYSMGNSEAYIYGGYFGNGASAYGESYLNIYEGNFMYNLISSERGDIAVYGGDFSTAYVRSELYSHSALYDGTFGTTQAYHHATMDIYGGEFIGNIISGYDGGTHDSVITIYGKDFNYDYGAIPVGSGILTGTLANGDLINNSFSIYSNAHILLAPIPEPATLSFLAIGGLLLRRRKA